MKLPAYGKRLLEQRRNGSHPTAVRVIYGDDWYVPEGVTRLAVKPGEALELDWRCVTGIPVELVCQVDQKDPGPTQLALEVYHLAAQITQSAAHVTIIYPGEGRIDASDFAFVCRRWNATTRRVEWPVWWSEEIEKKHAENWQRWLADTAAYLARAAA